MEDIDESLEYFNEIVVFVCDYMWMICFFETDIEKIKENKMFLTFHVKDLGETDVILESKIFRINLQWPLPNQNFTEKILSTFNHFE